MENSMIAALRAYLQRNNYDTFPLKAVLFDMDGVLYNSMPYHCQSWLQTMTEFGYHCTYEEFFLHEGRTGKSTINLLTQRELNRDATEDERQKIYARKSELFARYNTGETIPLAHEMLQAVQQAGLQSVVVTGSGQPTLLKGLNEKFPNVFTPEKIVSAADVINGKPHPEPYLKGLQRAGNLCANEAVVVENAPMGVQAAAAAGIFTIAINTGPIDEQILQGAGADIVLPSMESLYNCWNIFLQEVQNINSTK